MLRGLSRSDFHRARIIVPSWALPERNGEQLKNPTTQHTILRKKTWTRIKQNGYTTQTNHAIGKRLGFNRIMGPRKRKRIRIKFARCCMPATVLRPAWFSWLGLMNECTGSAYSLWFDGMWFDQRRENGHCFFRFVLHFKLCQICHSRRSTLF